MLVLGCFRHAMRPLRQAIRRQVIWAVKERAPRLLRTSAREFETQISRDVASYAAVSNLLGAVD